MTVTAEPELQAAPPGDALAAEPPAVDVVVPVYNEVEALAASVGRLHAYLADGLSLHRADHGRRQRQHRRHVGGGARARRGAPGGQRASGSTQKGRGRALYAVWSASDARVLAYMDVDLSTDLAALLPLVAPLISGHSDLAIGTPAHARRPGRARAQARADLALATTRSSTSCCERGSPTRSAASRRSVPTAPGELLPLVHDRAWFFDTELLVRRRARRAADPRGAGRLGRRPGLARRHRRDGARRPARGRPMRDSSPAGRHTQSRLRRPGRCASSRSACSRRWPTGCSTCCCATLLPAQGANALALLADRRREHGGEPALHLRDPRTLRTGCATSSRVSPCSCSPSR